VKHPLSIIRLTLTLSLTLALSLAVAPFCVEAEETKPYARKLMNAQGCKACHTLEGKGGNSAKSFEDIADRLKAWQIKIEIANPHRRHAAGKIGDFSHLTPEEINSLVSFIKQLETKQEK